MIYQLHSSGSLSQHWAITRSQNSPCLCFYLTYLILPTFLWDPGLRSPPLCLKSLKSSEFIFHLINIPDCSDSSLSACIWVLIPHALFAQVWQLTWYFSEEFIDINLNSRLILIKVITFHCIYWYIWWRCIKSLHRLNLLIVACSNPPFHLRKRQQTLNHHFD